MITIYTEKDSVRLRYIINELFWHMHGIEVEITTDAEQFTTASNNNPKICYAANHIGNSLHIKPTALLFENTIEQQNIDVEEEQGFHLLRTGVNTENSMAFDVFAASFYLVTRYEEYLDFTPDQHGRFKAEDSLAYKNGFLEEPVIDQWVVELLNKLRVLYPNTPQSSSLFRHIKTIDVDNVFAYRHKGPFINGIHILKDIAKGRTALAKQRLKAILRIEADPFFNLEELADTLKEEAGNTYFFFHCGGYGKHDKKTLVPSWAYAQIRKKISDAGFGVGLHPSYRCAHKEWLFKLEKKVLEFHLKKSVTQCRAHYLLFTLPHDYRILQRTGIKEDFTMGYSNNPGFRASTSIPFHFYDLEKEEATGLLIHPLAVMDKTLHSNMHLNAQEAKVYILSLAKKVKDVNGEFVTLFHNENQTDAKGFGWEGWNKMYKELLKEL